MDEHVADALERGAEVVQRRRARRRLSRRDLYWQATVLDGVPPESLVAQEETFGPVAPVVAIDSLEQAIELTNASPYGLLSAIFTRDLAKGLRFADSVRTGWVNINESSNYWETHLPFGGRSGTASGIGRVGGTAPMEAFTELQTVVLVVTYDYVIVGGGSAGCALANRLSADPSTSVLVLEAGRTDYLWDVFIHMPAALAFPIGNKRYDWMYESEPEPHMHGRRIYHARGKVLGGSSSINGMIFQRGNPLDYERWAGDPGLEEWDYAHCLPYFKRMENCLAGADEYRGGDGPAVLERGPATSPLFDAFFEAVQQAGYELTDDVNGQRQEGFAKFDRNDPPRPSPQRGARVPASGDRSRRTSRCAARRSSTASCSRGRARSASQVGGEIDPRERGHPLRRRDQLAAAPAALRRRQRARARGARHRRRARPAGRRREPAGPPRGLRPVRVHAAGVGAAGVEEVEAAVDRRAVALPAQRARRDEPLRGRRLRPLERRRRLPEPHVPLPAARDPLRRLVAGAASTATRCTSGRCTPTRAAR